MVEFSLDTLVLKPLLSMFVEMLKWSIRLFPNVGTDFFELSIIQQILVFFQYLMYGMFIIGSLLAIIDFTISYADGVNPNVMSTVKSICAGLFAALFMQKIILLAYEVIYFLTQKLFIIQSSEEMFSQQKLSDTFHFQTNNNMIGLIVVIILICLVLGVLVQFLERNGLFLLHQCTGVFFIISICRGYETAFSTWLKQGIILCFVNFMQMLLFVTALFFLQETTTALVAVGLMFTAFRIEKVVSLLPTMNRISFKQNSMIQAATVAFNRNMMRD